MKPLLLLCLAIPCFAMDPTLPKGYLQLKTTLAQRTAENYFDQNSTSITPDFEDGRAELDEQALDIEIAYGWRQAITIVFKVDYQSRELASDLSRLDNDGISRSYLGMRQRISPLSSNVRFTVETGIWSPIEADQEENLPLASGTIDWDMVVGYAQDFYPTKGGFEMDFGYRFRNGGPSDEYFFNAAFKVDFKTLGRGTLNYRAAESKNENKIAYLPTVYPLERGFQTIGAQVDRHLGKSTNVALGYEKVLNGRNYFKTSGFHLKFSWIF